MGGIIACLLLNSFAVLLLGYCLSFEYRKGWRIADWILLVLNVVLAILNICRLINPNLLG